MALMVLHPICPCGASVLTYPFLSLELLTQAHSSPCHNAELMLIVSTTGHPCHCLVQIWGLKGDHCKADLCSFVCMQLLAEKLATA